MEEKWPKNDLQKYDKKTYNFRQRYRSALEQFQFEVKRNWMSHAESVSLPLNKRKDSQTELLHLTQVMESLDIDISKS